MKKIELFIIIVLSFQLLSNARNEKKYLKFILYESKVLDEKYRNSAIDLELNIRKLRQKVVFRDVTNNSKCPKNELRTWSTVFSIYQDSINIYYTILKNKPNAILEIKINRKNNLDDKMTLFDETFSVEFLIKIILCNVSPEESYVIFTITHFVEFKEKALKNSYISLWSSINTSSIDLGEIFYFSKIIKFSDIKEKQISHLFSYSLFPFKKIPNFTYRGPKEYFLVDENLKIVDFNNSKALHLDIRSLTQKYHYIDLSDENLKITILIHSEFFKSPKLILKEYDRDTAQNIRYNKFEKIVCRDTRRIGPPVCSEKKKWGYVMYYKTDVSGMLLKSRSNIFYRNASDCKKGYFGEFCQNKKKCKKCETIKCKSGSTCSSCINEQWHSQNQYFLGAPGKICLNDGLCLVEQGKINCHCKYGYVGTYCEIDCKFFCNNNNCTYYRDIIICLEISKPVFEKKSYILKVLSFVDASNNNKKATMIFLLLITISFLSLVFIFVCKICLKKRNKKPYVNLIMYPNKNIKILKRIYKGESEEFLCKLYDDISAISNSNSDLRY